MSVEVCLYDLYDLYELYELYELYDNSKQGGSYYE